MIKQLLILLIIMSSNAVFSETAPSFAENKVFGPGESLEFEVKYGFISGGFARMEVLDTVRMKNRLCYEIRVIAHSNSTLSVFYPIRDTNISFVDVYGLFSHEIVKLIREGNYKRYRTTEFDQVNGIAVTQDFTTKKDSTMKTVPNVQDIISSFYYFRTLDVSDFVDINCLDDYTAYPLRVRIWGKETIKTPLGKFKCIHAEPMLTSSGIFLKKGKMSIWLTDDERKLPVMMRVKIPILGSVTCYLVGYNPPTLLDQKALSSPLIMPNNNTDIIAPKPQTPVKDTLQ